jgi:amidase
MPTTAFPHDHKPEHERTIQVDDEVRSYNTQLFWAGLSGGVYLPSTMIPAGPADDGLPVGVQMIGGAYSDMKLIDIAERLEEASFGFRPPPGYDA